jgi:hypothetical protein
LEKLHLVSADVLGDAAGFSRCYVGFADGVEQGGLAVIDVAHDGDDGRTGNFKLAGVVGFEDFFDGLVGDLFLVADDGGGCAELGGHVLDHLGVEGLVDGDEDAAHEEGGDEVLGADFELFGQILDADALGDGDFAGDGQGLAAVLDTTIAWRRHKALHRAFLGFGILRATAAATGRGTLRARSLAGWRSAAGPGWTAGARGAEAGTRAECGARTGGARARLCRRNRQRWCGWGAWGADRRGTGLFRARRRGCAADSCQGRYRACCGRRLVCRVECLQLRFQRQAKAEGQPQGAPCRTAEALFAASPCAGRAAPAWAMRACAPFHGGRTDAPARRQQYQQLLREL